jgi:hypothetical protein
MSTSSLHALAAVIEALPDPRSKQGVSHSYHGMIAIVLLGLIAQMPYVAEMRRWAKKHWKILKEPLHFKKDKPPVETTIFRALEKTTVEDFQHVFDEFLRNILAENHENITVAVDGKTAKQMKNADGTPHQMLNCFVHDVQVTLASPSVLKDKTNEPGCLKTHIPALVAKYPMLKLLTGDAIFAQRPLLEVLQECGCDYLFQVKENQPDILDAAKTSFAEVTPWNPDAAELKKKGAESKSAKYGVTLMMPNMSVNG